MTERLTDEERRAVKADCADIVAEQVQTYISMLIEGGAPGDAVLAGAHAGIITSMVAALGGPETAAACRRAEARVRDMPSAAAAALAFVPPKGSA